MSWNKDFLPSSSPISSVCAIKIEAILFLFMMNCYKSSFQECITIIVLKIERTCTRGRTYAEVRTQIFRTNGLPNLLTHGAPRASLSINQSINQWTNVRTKEWTKERDQSIYRSVNRYQYQSINQSINQWTKVRMKEWTKDRECGRKNDQMSEGKKERVNERTAERLQKGNNNVWAKERTSEQTKERVHERTNEWASQWRNKRTNEQTNEATKEWVKDRTYIWMNTWKNR